MMDQANKLRQIIDNLKLKEPISEADEKVVQKNKSAKVITVTSGKGGVGKTNITINLAIALSEMGKRVTIMDADLGLGNIDVLLGVVPKYTLVDVIYNNKNIVEILSDGPKNIKFIAGGSGIEDLAKLDNYQIQKFLANISLLDKMSDVILIDTGAGLSDNVMSFVMAADEVVLVATPEPTSITDAYALIKVISKRDVNKTVRLIINRAESVNEASDITNKLSMVTKRFLEVKLQPLGFIPQDNMVIKAVKMQQPFSLSFPKSMASKQIKDISKNLLEIKNNADSGSTTGIKSFVSRFVNILNG
ncbi:MinD/ParA family protein [Herbivorax sp. ANBcel31]|uniref:MinD/ParA family protein n=1 Tax=Herbivorax sp. ANBcel31 TaxID=3069754 RepID=UPI0027B6C9A5|nr:MinD/ParA family protein [Herbivorax sp. ANBcel31]MDQ2085875.1 MinD/ParA family protein [Herbivorax sp. ANBcel31]